MGWLWNSSTTKRDESQPTQSTPASEGFSTPHARPQLTPEQQADAEFSQLWESLKSDINQAEEASSSSTPSQTQTPSSALQLQSQSTPASIAPDSLYADTMSCRSAFDYAFFCQSLGGQFVNVYRYGEMRSCSEHWENFWLCMRTRTAGDAERRRVIREHNRKKAIKYKTGPSSEDVWEVRMEPVKAPFQSDFAALEREMKAAEEAQNIAKNAPNATI
ncbi:EMI1 family protein [Aspergillus undulatus]|uniref:EMI1 family protein n=1 Tax=Aspergillus undulatus TaxID=1810928 RepID=UPI003CCC997F